MHFFEVAEPKVEPQCVSNGSSGAKDARAFFGVVFQERSEIRVRTSVARLPAPSGGDGDFDFAQERLSGRLGGTLAATSAAIGIAPTDTPFAISFVEARHRFRSIHQGLIRSASQR